MIVPKLHRFNPNLGKDSTVEKLIGVPEVAEWIGVPVATVRVWRHRGIGPRSIKCGRWVKYRPSDVERWLDSQSDDDRAGAVK